eukprot:Trichotokara_eunicae@DN7909_c0_g1_i1.p1
MWRNCSNNNTGGQNLVGSGPQLAASPFSSFFSSPLGGNSSTGSSNGGLLLDEWKNVAAAMDDELLILQLGQAVDLNKDTTKGGVDPTRKSLNGLGSPRDPRTAAPSALA